MPHYFSHLFVPLEERRRLAHGHALVRVRILVVNAPDEVGLLRRAVSAKAQHDGQMRRGHDKGNVLHEQRTPSLPQQHARQHSLPARRAACLVTPGAVPKVRTWNLSSHMSAGMRVTASNLAYRVKRGEGERSGGAMARDSAPGAQLGRRPRVSPRRALCEALVPYSRDRRDLGLGAVSCGPRGGDVHAHGDDLGAVPPCIGPRPLFSYLGLGDGVGGLDGAVYHAALVLYRLVLRHGAHADLDTHGGGPGQRRGEGALRQWWRRGTYSPASVTFIAFRAGSGLWSQDSFPAIRHPSRTRGASRVDLARAWTCAAWPSESRGSSSAARTDRAVRCACRNPAST